MKLTLKTSRSANKLRRAVFAAASYGLIAPSTYKDMKQVILESAELETRTGVHSDWLQMVAMGAEQFEYEIAQLVELASTKKFAQWLAGESLSYPLLRRGLSAAATNAPSPFPGRDSAGNTVDARQSDVPPPRSPTPPCANRCTLQSDLAA